MEPKTPRRTARTSATRRESARPAGDPSRRPEADIPRRLLDVNSTAVYLGVSPWTVRELEWAGVLRRVRVPLPKGRELRKLLFDRLDLDRLIDAWKESR